MLKLNIGLSKKIGESNYGSRGAAVNLELELESGLADQPTRLKERIRQLFTMAKAAVEEELRCNKVDGDESALASSNGNPVSAPGTNGHQPGQPNGNGHRASRKQLDYAQQLAGQIRGLGIRRLETLADKMFGKPLADLSSLDASGLIDVLKEIKAGKIDLDAALNGVAK